MFRRVLAVLALSAATVFAVAAPASAHHIDDTDLVLSAACEHATGTFTIGATLTNSAAGNSAFTIQSNTKALTFAPTTINQGASATASDPGEPGGVLYTLTVSGKFATDETDSATASITPTGECETPTTQPPSTTPPTDQPRVAVPVVGSPRFTG